MKIAARENNTHEMMGTPTKVFREVSVGSIRGKIGKSVAGVRNNMIGMQEGSKNRQIFTPTSTFW